MNLTNLKTIVTKNAGRGLLVAKKYSPEILMGVGVVGIVTSTVMACKATLKAEAVMDAAKEKFDKIKEVREMSIGAVIETNYSETDYRKDMIVAYTQTSVDFIKLYGPAVTLGVASIACILGAHNVMRKRNVALIAAYKAIEGGFKDYRKRVVEELGTDKDYQFRHGIKQETITEIETDETGKSKKVKKTVDIIDPNKHSIYARFFDESSPNWQKVPEYSLVFLKCQQNYANDMLHARGHIFLNEVYDLLGIPRTKEGSVVGWCLGHGDDFVDFGIYEFDSMKARDFVNGYERSILLDFNVDGLIYDLI